MNQLERNQVIQGFKIICWIIIKCVGFAIGVAGLMYLILSIFTLSAHAQSSNIEDRFGYPDGYERIYNDTYSKFLREHPLKDNNVVKYFNGKRKYNNNIWAAVYDYDIGPRDLHQCADAVIYMRASWMYSEGRGDDIELVASDGTIMPYRDWLKGVIWTQDGNGLKQVMTKPRKDNCDTFRKYLDHVFIWAGTYSLQTYETYQVDIYDIQPGDVFVVGGFPGHAVNVVDVGVNEETGHKYFILAQSYMPAQQNQILLNPATGDVFYELFDFMTEVVTPDWTFHVNDLRRWH